MLLLGFKFNTLETTAFMKLVIAFYGYYVHNCGCEKLYL